MGGPFHKKFAALLKASLPPQAEGKPVEIWFQDEARVGQQGNLKNIWAPRGSRPRAVRDNRRDSVYLFGALCPGRAVGAAVIMPAANSEAMGIHLAEISTQVAPGAHAVVLCDGAGWHQTGGALKLPSNLSLLPIPPYSPELNPMENVWDYLRGNQLSHQIWGHIRRHPPSLRQGVALPGQRPAAHPINRTPRMDVCQSVGGLVSHRTNSSAKNGPMNQNGSS
jgi:hypothetical protein